MLYAEYDDDILCGKPNIFIFLVILYTIIGKVIFDDDDVCAYACHNVAILFLL